jgi:hypothetical protein
MSFETSHAVASFVCFVFISDLDPVLFQQQNYKTRFCNTKFARSVNYGAAFTIRHLRQ